MTVSFGKVTTAYFGQTRLTKDINKGAFYINSRLSLAQVWQVAAQTCADYPAKPKRFPKGEYRAVIRRERSGHQFIAYGDSAKSKSGEDIVLIPDWKLACLEVQGYKVLKLASAKLASGAIREVEEMEFWINEFERNLRGLDPQATVTLQTQGGSDRLPVADGQWRPEPVSVHGCT